ncbi:Chromatin modification-related protein EAF7, partial [Rhizoctonia solani]
MSDDHEFEPQAPDGFLDTLEGEIALFRSIERARPVGMHKHFHMLTLRRSIRNESGFWVNVADIWAKLATLYHLDALDDMDEQQFHPVTGRLIVYPSVWDADELYSYPAFNEFALPYSQFNELMHVRRAASPGAENEKPRKRHLNAGLINDDSDLSDLTEGEDDAETDGATEPPDDTVDDDAEADTPDDTPAVNRRGARKSNARAKQPTKGAKSKSSGKKKKLICYPYKSTVYPDMVLCFCPACVISTGVINTVGLRPIATRIIGSLDVMCSSLWSPRRNPHGSGACLEGECLLRDLGLADYKFPTHSEKYTKYPTPQNHYGAISSSPLYIPPAGIPGEQEWIIEQRSEDSIALRNLKHNKYAGVAREPTENAQVVPVDNPFEFKVETTEDGQHRYKLYVQSGDQRLYADFSWLRIYPPQCALIPQQFPTKPWEFSYLE